MTVLSVRTLSLGYREAAHTKTILRDFSLDIGAGELVCLLGRAAWANPRCCACWRG
uniref:Uncharacterized protein n=1 Tax=Conchiformibius kuhniae TaxID=211502 RepID=A0A8T9MTV2_9NEIS|nr:hypothetical protein LVJ77_01530 [Conchiformibius kuhniae]